ncbi:MAG TPA: hypothetical protein VMV46_04020 [Thermoanaerobaculia bacterium]|nr:hypothetical protein [Thermoanaerobaculia bacterium]
MLRLASVATARRLGLENALGLAASAGFDRVELRAGDLPAQGPERLAPLGALLAELGIRLASLDVPLRELTDERLLELGDRARELGCHRLTVELDAALGVVAAERLGPLLDGVGYRLAGRSGELVVRLAAGGAEPAHAVLAAVLAQLSQRCVGLELEAAGAGPGDGLEDASAWRPRVRALALDDLALVDAPTGSWSETGSPGTRALAWLRRAPEVELVIRHAARSTEEGDDLSRARSRWRRDVELARGRDRSATALDRTMDHGTMDDGTMYSRIPICRWGIAHVEEGHTGGTDHA